ncbi:Uncharacterised protein [uncultured archaeon]|nr:Uncharacterised protein [uncultured archaeon]
MAPFSVLQHVDFVYHHRSHPFQVFPGTYDLIYALVGACYYVSTKILAHLPPMPQLDPADSNTYRCVKSELVISG